MTDNEMLAEMLEDMAVNLERQGANPHRIRAYRAAAKSIVDLPMRVVDMLARGMPLTTIAGVGTSLANTLAQLVATGKPPPARVHPMLAHKRPSTKHKGAFLRPKLTPLVDALTQDLSTIVSVRAVQPVGAYRRRVETVEALEVLVSARDPHRAMQGWANRLDMRVEPDGGTTMTVVTPDGVPVCVRFLSTTGFGAAVLEATGSLPHIQQLRAWAKRRKKAWPPPGGTEEACYRAIGLPFIPAELREGQGEVEAATTRTLPELVEVSDLRGDLHMHTVATDGASSIEAMARGARKRGLSYVAITDHTQRTSIARGLTPDRMRAHLRRIDAANDEAKSQRWGITILKGAEVDILRGGLDLPDDVLDELDVTVCSLHHRNRQSGPELTRRILAAMSNPKAHILGHATGRLIGRRPEMSLDWRKLLDAASGQGWAIEVNGQAERLDPPAPAIRRAAQMGIRFALNSDAHSVREMEFQQNAVDQARRGWVPRNLVLNAGTLSQLRHQLRG